MCVIKFSLKKDLILFYSSYLPIYLSLYLKPPEPDSLTFSQSKQDWLEPKPDYNKVKNNLDGKLF